MVDGLFPATSVSRSGSELPYEPQIFRSQELDSLLQTKHLTDPPGMRWPIGGIAQLGEHLICIQKVAGSIPVASTNEFLGLF